MRTTDLFSIDSMPMIAPDKDLVYFEEDLVSSDSGFDESGAYHRFVVRHGIKNWDFTYSRLTKPEYQYMESLFAGKDTFSFLYRSNQDDSWQEITAYRSKHSVLWYSTTDDQFRDYRFRITAC